MSALIPAPPALAADPDGLDAESPRELAAAVERTAKRLRTADGEPADLAALVEKLTGLAAHPSERVRRSVALVAAHFPERAWLAIHAALADDVDHYVCAAVRNSARLRATLRREAARNEEHDERVDRWYRALDREGARVIALRIATHETEYFVRRMVHEAGASFASFDVAAAELRRLLGERHIDTARARASLTRMEERMAFLRHVLETGRERAQHVEPVFRPERIAALVTDEVTLLATRFPDRAARLAVDMDGVAAALEVDLDASFFRQAISNILKNAVEAYSPTGTEPIVIRVTASVAPGATDVELVIADRAYGMHPEQVQKAFVPFGSSKPGGTGFGLFIARRVAQNVHGGEITLQSTIGKGTRVTMTLPLRQELGRARRPPKRARKKKGAP